MNTCSHCQLGVPNNPISVKKIMKTIYIFTPTFLNKISFGQRDILQSNL